MSSIYYDRRVHNDLVEVLAPGGPLHGLATIAAEPKSAGWKSWRSGDQLHGTAAGAALSSGVSRVSRVDGVFSRFIVL